MHLQRAGTLLADAPDAVGNNMDVSVVIVNYNHDAFVYKCVNSVVESGRVPACTIVVDNASKNPPLELRRNGDGEQVQVILNQRNIGFARAVNQGIEQTKTNYVLLLNPDAVIKPGAIEKLVEFMDDNPDIGIAGCKLLHPDGSLQWSCRTFYTPITILFRRSPLGKLWPNNPISRWHLMADWDHKTPRTVDWVLGACMMVRREAIRDVGMLDEKFFLYFEDVDWCFRMQQHGWRVCYYPGAEITHYHQRSSSRFNITALHHLRSMIYYYRKHFLSNLLPDRQRTDRRTEILQRLLRIRRISRTRRVLVAASYMVSRILSTMSKYASGQSRGRAPSLVAVHDRFEISSDTVGITPSREDREL
jgi:GT2 family glycosyltransferase